jgi:hypothetical protein
MKAEVLKHSAEVHWLRRGFKPLFNFISLKEEEVEVELNLLPSVFCPLP